MDRKTIPYKIDERTFNGYFVYNEIVDEPRPGILLAHAWRGQDDFVKQKADELARLGYVAFAADLYGMGKHVETDEEAAALMLPLFLDRAELRKRIVAAYETFIKQPRVDGAKIGAIGFCFGGLTVIELLRSGAPVKGVVSFHGVLGNTMGEHQAVTAPDAEGIKGALLMLHGHDDPLVSQSDIANIQQEFTRLGVDWEMDIYGLTAHAFTNPEANNSAAGLKYQERSATRAWKSMRRFFDEYLK